MGLRRGESAKSAGASPRIGEHISLAFVPITASLDPRAHASAVPLCAVAPSSLSSLYKAIDTLGACTWGSTALYAGRRLHRYSKATLIPIVGLLKLKLYFTNKLSGRSMAPYDIEIATMKFEGPRAQDSSGSPHSPATMTRGIEER